MCPVLEILYFPKSGHEVSLLYYLLENLLFCLSHLEL